MSLKETGLFRHLDWQNWLAGLITAFMTGFATAGSASFALYLQDPKDYNPFQSRFWIAFGTIIFFSGGSNFFAYLKQNPVPRTIEQESVTTTVKPSGATTVETIKTSIPVDPPAAP